MRDDRRITFVLPAREESVSVATVVGAIRERYPGAEILVVDDGSTDETGAQASQYASAVHRHVYPKGNGAAIKTGARSARGAILAFLDADGQHAVDDIARLLERFDEGYDMVVGARRGPSHAGFLRRFGNALYNRLASYVVGQRVEDLTSGFRICRKDRFREFINLLPNGFSYPTTITMAFFRAGYSVGYVPVDAQRREGRSHLSPLHDGARFLLIIFKVAALYSPLKIFVPVSVAFFCTGLGYYLYTYLNFARFTNMSALLFITSVLVFLIGLVAEQITMLLYKTD